MIKIGLACVCASVCVSLSAATETACWQDAIDAAAAKGGGVVTVPAGRHLVGQLDLKSNVELRLEEGAVLEGVSGIEWLRWGMTHGKEMLISERVSREGCE